MNVSREKMKNLLLSSPFDDDDTIGITMFNIEIDNITVLPYFQKMKSLSDPTVTKYSCNCRIKFMGTTDITYDHIFNNVDDVLSKFEEIMQYKFVGQHCIDSSYLFVSPQKYENMKIKYEYIYALQQKEYDECYVCYEHTFGHKTCCGHHICPHCFYKSMKDCEDCGEKKTTFECGMCKKKIAFCEECDDDDDEKYDDDEDDDDDEEEEQQPPPDNI